MSVQVRLLAELNGVPAGRVAVTDQESADALVQAGAAQYLGDALDRLGAGESLHDQRRKGKDKRVRLSEDKASKGSETKGA